VVVQRRIARITGREDTKRRAGLVSSQLMGVALSRYFLKLPGVADRPPAEIVADIGPTLQRYLMGRLPSK